MTFASLSHESKDACPQCGSNFGRKLSRNALEEGTYRFFVQGSTPTGRGIFAPIIQINPTHEPSDLFGTAELEG